MPARMNGLRTLPSSTRSTGRPTAVTQREKFAERGAVVALDRHHEINVGSSRIEVRAACGRAQHGEPPDAEAAAERGNLRPAFGNQWQQGRSPLFRLCFLIGTIVAQSLRIRQGNRG